MNNGFVGFFGLIGIGTSHTMTSTASHLDPARLEKVRQIGTKIIARCPACAENGGDRRGNHLAILPSGKFACAAYPGDSDHRSRIFALVGVRGNRERAPEQDRQWRERRDRDKAAAEAKQRLAGTARAMRDKIVQRNSWPMPDVWESSPQRIDCDLVELDPRHFLMTLFPDNAIVWTGHLYQSGDGRFADRWRAVSEWLDSQAHKIGPMVSPCTWPPGTISRASANVGTEPFTVLDFDEIDGRKPETPSEIEALQNLARAITRWLRESLGWRLAAIVATGGKGLHCWFHHPGQAALASLLATASEFGIDTGLIGHPEHTARLPGQRHAKTGKRSKVIWLQAPTP